MRILIGDGGDGGAARARTRDPCLHVRDPSGARIFSSLHVEAPPPAETDLVVMAALDGIDGGDGDRYPMTVELTSASKSKSK